MHPEMRIEAVLWDFGGVLVRTEDRTPREAWETRLKAPPGGLSNLVFDGEAAARATLGQASLPEVWAEVGARLGLSEAELQSLEQDFWRGDRLDAELVAEIRTLRTRVRNGMISNAWPGLRERLESEWHIADAFDPIVLSYEAGMRKPDPGIYHLALERMGLAPAQAVFVDDFERNVRGARDVGMHAVRFESRKQVLAALNQLLEGSAGSPA